MFASRMENFQKIEEQPVGRNPVWWTFRIYEAYEHDPDIILRSMVPSSMRKDEIFISRFLDLLNLTRTSNRTSIRTSSRQVFKASRVLTFEFYTFPETRKEVCGRLLNSELQVHGQQSKPLFRSVSSETETERPAYFTKRTVYQTGHFSRPRCPNKNSAPGRFRVVYLCF